MSGIFISYRREDSAGWTGRLTDSLKEHFGPESIFMDIDGIELGTDFTVALHRALESCTIVLAMIGPEWATLTDKSGRPRIEDPTDWVRVEIATALKRRIRVVPVLVGGASVPTMDLLPDELDPLAHRQAHELTDKRWSYDVEHLINLLSTTLQKPWLLPKMQLWRSTPVMIGMLVFAVMVGIWAVVTSLYTPLPLQPNASNSMPPASPDKRSTQNTLSPGPPDVGKAEQSAYADDAIKFPIALRVGQEARLRDHVTSCVYKVLAAQVERSRSDLFSLRMTVRVTNEGSLTTNFGDSNFRLLVDNVPRAPTGNLNDLVDANSAKEGTIVFAVPVNARRLVLQFLMGDEMATFPL
jgi:hypothetical protein